MTPDDLDRLLRAELGRIAPDADLGALDRGADLRDTLELDSMDFLNLVTALDARLGISVPERDYPRMRTLGGAIDYLAERLA